MYKVANVVGLPVLQKKTTDSGDRRMYVRFVAEFHSSSAWTSIFVLPLPPYDRPLFLHFTHGMMVRTSIFLPQLQPYVLSAAFPPFHSQNDGL